MSFVEYLTGIGIIGIILLCIFVVIFILCAPIIVAIFIANALGLSGIVWWAFVVVIWLIIASIISKASST